MPHDEFKPESTGSPNTGYIPAEARAGSAPPTPIVLQVPREPLFVGAYSKVPVRIAGSGLSIDDLDFSVPEGAKGGLVSLSRDHSFYPKEPDVMLLAGYEPGIYRLQVLKKGTTTVLGEAKFAVTDDWKDELASPPFWYTGIMHNYAAGATWGGGSSGPQNINVHPALGTRRLMILFVDTNSQRYTTDAATLQSFQKRWRDSVVDGFTGPDGIVRSVRAFYQEVSYRNLDISAQIFGNVVHLPNSNSWDDYFQTDGNGNWQYKGQFHQQCVTAAGNTLDLTNIDMLICVSQGFSTATPNPKIAWPYGAQGVALTTSHGNVTVGVVSMPNEWGDGSSNDQSGGRTIYETLSHELGHTLGLPDEYTPSVTGRNIGDPNTNTSWDPMDWERPLPHFTLAHRMMLGWVPAGWLSLFNFQSLGAVVDQPVTLSPVEDGAPPAARSAGIEVRIGDGRNYYLEYRTGQTGEIGDRLLLPNNRVVGTDVSEPPDLPVISRPDILLLAQHSDDNGPVLDNSQFYHEVDNTTPTFPSDFRVDVSGIDGNKADVRIRYGVIGKPDPSIHPWPKDANHQWQSPDIEVRNARQAGHPEWADVPWLGHNNTVVAHITNRGTLSAPGVVANFFVKDYTVGGAPETFLGFDRHDIPPGATVDFTTTWNPPRDGHFCIVVRIDPYQTPTTPPVPEMTDTNNVAQSNYDRFISATSSPASREITSVTVGNPFDRPTRVFIVPGQSNPVYRTYLEHTWLQLNPGEVKQVMTMFEYAPEPLLATPQGRGLVEEFQRVPNNVGLVSYIENPQDPQLHQALLFSGVQAEVVTGRATKIQEFVANDEIVRGEVVTVDDSKVVPGGRVLVIFTGDGKEEMYEEGQLTDGQFIVRVPVGWRTVEAYYVPLAGYGDSTSGVLKR